MPQNSTKEFKTTPIVLAILSALTITAVIFLSATKRGGLRRVGIILVTIGVFMLLFAWGWNKVITSKVVPDIKLDNKVLQSKVQNLVGNVADSITKNYYIFGGAYAGLGALAIGGTMFIGKPGSSKKSKSDTPKEDKTPTKPAPAASAVTPAPAYKMPAKRPPAKKKILVQ